MHGGPGRALALVILAASCARTPPLDDRRDAAPDAARVASGRDAGGDAAVVPIGCAPAGEVCNGEDDDCDGSVDELPPMACEAGGTRLCIAGRWSECPRRCEACIPGSERVCFLSYCTYWGIQRCAADGRGFGPCVEKRAPAECIDIALARRDSPQLEQCCADNGYCCLDRHDLDGDGDRSESVGTCEGVLCDP